MTDSTEHERVRVVTRVRAGLRQRAAIWTLVLSCLAPACFAQVLVEPVYATWVYPDSDADSVATWVAPDPADSLMFVTEKDGDRVEVWLPATGRPYAPMHFIGGDQNSDEEGQFDRPNAVWVVYHVPFQDEFVDILLVCEQLNGRVQIFRLPELTYFGQFAAGDLSTSRVFGRGLGPYHDGEDHFVIVTDRKTTDKVKRYRLVEDGDVLGAELIDAFGDETGDDELNIVESVLVDTAHDRIHVCGDEWRTTGEGVNGVRVFDLEGEYTGVTYGEPDFQFDVEGIVLYETGPRDGYIIVSDQYNNGEPNEFEVYDRATLERVGNFECPDDGPLVTTNTDGIYLEQRPFPGHPNGAFYAINDDMNLHAYDWTDIAEALDLEIVALDRPFAHDSADLRQPDLPRRSLWHEDSSWWGLFSGSPGLELRRLEDGTFARQGVVDDGVTSSAVAVRKTSVGIVALAAGDGAKLYRMDYDASLRRYETTETIDLDLGGSERAGLSVDPADDAWIAWSVGGRLRVSGAPIDDLSSWPDQGQNLEATEIHPELAHLDGQTVLLAADGISAFACFHTDGAGSRSWRGPSRFGAEDVEAISAVVVEEQLVVSLSTASGVDVWTRDGAGDWSLSESLDAVSSAALSVDSATGAIYLTSAADGPTKRSIAVRSTTGPGEPFGTAGDLISVPGVDMGPPLTSQLVPGAAGELLVASIGHDGVGYFARVPLPERPDVSAPVTMQHLPSPGAGEVDDVDIVSFRIVDRASGIDRAALRVLIDGEEVATRIRGLSKNLLVEADLPDESSRVVRVRIEAADLSDPPHVMVPFEYSFALRAPRRRADINADSNVDVSDAVALLLYLFSGGVAPVCDAIADVDDNGNVELTDAVSLLEFLFRGGPAPSPLSPEELEACGGEAESEEFTLTSSVFDDGSIIPPRNTCESDDVSPPFEWSYAPEGTRSFALTCIDIDSRAGTWIHWISWDIPGTATSLDEGEEPPVDGTNQWRRRGYGGPCPGRGSGFHRYVFTLHALDVSTLSIPGSSDLDDLEDAMVGHVIESTTLTGRYRRD